MEWLADLVENPVHRHIALNHLPIVGLFTATIALLAGVILRNDGQMRTGLALVALMAASAFPVVSAGEASYRLVYDTLNATARQRLDEHADLAADLIPLLYLLAGTAGLGTILPSRGMRRIAVLTTGLAFVGLGASISIGAKGGGIRHHGDPVSATSNSGARGANEAIEPAALLRLSRAQYEAAIHETFGPGIPIPDRHPPTPRRAGLLAVGRSQTTISPDSLDRYWAMASSIARAILTDPAARQSFSCEHGTPLGFDAECTGRAIARAGEGLFRRPLSDREVASRQRAAQEVFSRTGDSDRAMEAALISLLASPHFLFRIAPDGSSTGNNTAVASQLSYLLWDRGPDEELRQLAHSGALSNQQILEEQVDRMLSSPYLHTGVRAFFDDMLRFAEFETLSKDVEHFPSFSPGVAADAREQTLRTLSEHIVDLKADFRELFTTRRMFLTRSLGPIYRLPVAPRSGWESIELPTGSSRIGLLGQASLLMLNAHEDRSSPTLRGRFIREVFLCQSVPPPPADVDFTLFVDDENEENATARQKLQAHSTEGSCRSCHRATDPLGLGLDRFDGIGRFRTLENGVEIDARGDLDGTAFADEAELGEALSRHPRLTRCLSETLYRYALGRPTTEADRDVLDELHARFEASRFRVDALLRAVALHPSFIEGARRGEGAGGTMVKARGGQEAS
jgi:hypothetical protein